MAMTNSQIMLGGLVTYTIDWVGCPPQRIVGYASTWMNMLSREIVDWCRWSLEGCDRELDI